MEVAGKKVTVKFYLNKELKKRTVDFGDGSLYPLYARVTYDRRSTKFAIGNNLLHEVNEENISINPFLISFEEVIVKIITYELSVKKDKFVLNGLGSRIRAYASPLLSTVDLFIQKHIETKLEEVLTIREMNEWKKLPIINKAPSGFSSLIDHNLATENTLQHMQVYSIACNLPKDISIYSWLIGEERLGAKNVLKKKIEEGSKELGYIDPSKVKGLNEFNWLVGLIDEFCRKAVETGYSYQPELVNISWDPDTKKLSFQISSLG